ncbi:MAG: thioredoxin family protein [Bacteroidota bacterium]|nr:thioredoxin family protein [Bacteroidota bacterium]MDP4212537.1 thioredoxin family protein [Bacteroidota bacterium]MDP4250505.1 thioredoxin family protein [Bacteroidota bacterium]
MKKYLFYLIPLIVPFIVWSFCVPTVTKVHGTAGAGIQFLENSWAKALEQAKKENKPIFLDAYASWCGPCKLLKKNTFTKKEAGDFFNTHFINVAIDMEKGDGPSLSQKFEVDAYPTLIIADKNGNIVTYTKGYMNADQLIEFGNYGLKKYQQ